MLNGSIDERFSTSASRRCAYYFGFGKQMIDALLLASGRLWQIRFPRLMLNSLRRILGSSMIRLNMSNWSADHYVALLKGAER